MQATRDARAADRTVTAWARDNAADLRRLAGQVTSLSDLAPGAQAAVGALDQALGGDDAAGLIGPWPGPDLTWEPATPNSPTASTP